MDEKGNLEELQPMKGLDIDQHQQNTEDQENQARNVSMTL